MRKIREVLRLKAAGMSSRQIAAAIGSALSTVQVCLRRAEEAGVAWPLPEGLSEEALHERLYGCVESPATRPVPDFAYLHAELSRPGVTRWLLWQEYKAAQPDGRQYSVFCDRYRRWLATQEPVLRQNHACERALALKSYSYRAVRTLIELPAPPAATPALDVAHDNLRGPEYFQ